MPETPPRGTGHPRLHRLADQFAYGYRAPPGASPAYRIWCVVAAGLVHLGWWYSGVPLSAVLPDPRHERGTP